MLTDSERFKLENRDKLDEKFDLDDRKANEYNVRQKFKNWLADAEDVNLLLDHLPGRQFKKIVENNNLSDIMGVILRMLSAMGTSHIIEKEFVPTGNIIPSRRKKDALLTRPSPHRGYAEVIRRAGPEEMERAELVKDFIIRLCDHLGDDDLADIRDEINDILF
jgi:hypothetical protein